MKVICYPRCRRCSDFDLLPWSRLVTDISIKFLPKPYLIVRIVKNRPSVEGAARVDVFKSYGDVSPQDLILSRATNSRPKICISPDPFGVHNYCSLDSVDQASPYHSATLLFVLISVRLKDHTYVNTLLVLNEFHHKM